MIDKESHLPLYFQLAEGIRHLIESEAIKNGEKIESETEMMQRYGVGRLTVRSALAHLVHLGYLRKEHGKGTFCSYAPKADERINVDVLLDIQDAYFTPYYLKSISHVLDKEKYNMVVYDTGDNPKQILKQLRRIAEKTRGVIFQPSHVKENLPEGLVQCIQHMQEDNIPFIMIDSAYDIPNASYLHLDEVEGGRIAAKHLLNLGHQKLAVIYHENFQDSYQRFKGFSEIIEQKASCELFRYPYKDENYLQVVQDIKSGVFTAVFCYNDDMAVRLLRILKKNDIVVPDDISVLGFDDSVLASATQPALTSISHPKQELGEEAARIMIDFIQKRRSPPCQRLFTPGLVFRDSSRVLTRK